MFKRLKLKSSMITKISGICGIMLPIVIFICIAFAIILSPWFEWTEHALSDLGIEGIAALFFNLGLVIGGILGFIFSVGLQKQLSKKIGSIILSISSLALIGVGLFPETKPLLHFFVAAAFFVLLILAFLIIGQTTRTSKFEYNMGILASVFVIMAITSTIFLLPFNGVAVTEAFSCFPAFIWCMIYGNKMAFTNHKNVSI